MGNIRTQCEINNFERPDLTLTQPCTEQEGSDKNPILTSMGKVRYSAT